jgi:hypothetical protein
MKLLAWIIVIGACAPQAANSSWYGPSSQQQQPGAQPQPVAQPVGLNCIQIVQCLSRCGQDAACPAPCIASGSPASQSAVTALIQCNSANESNCEAELDACRADSGVATNVASEVPTAPDPAPSGTFTQPSTLGQPHSNAGILSWLVGQWIGNNHQFTFWADGTVRRASGTPLYTEKGTYGCVSTINETGTVTQQGDMLIMVFPTSDGNHCGTKESTSGFTVRYRMEWVENHYDQDPNLQLVLRDIDCTKGGMWCDDAMTRR